MRLATRMKITYGMFFLIPIVLIVVSFWGIGRIELRALQQKYDMEEGSVEMLFNPFEMLGNISVSVVEELAETAESTPERLSDIKYLETVDKRLEKYSSFLVLRKDGKIYYSGQDEEINEDVENIIVEAAKDNYITGDEPYHLKQLSFQFPDGSEGIIQIFTPVEMVVKQVERVVLKVSVCSLIILLLVSAIAFTWLYQSIVQPLEKLKRAAVNIKDGNLDFNVITDTEDEIGEVCIAFEEMRIKLKDQIEVSMQYEKDNKELLSNISHDLKTPITAIKGYVEGIRDGVADTPEKMDKYIRTIYNKATDMDKLIDELFLFSKLDSNSMNYSFAKLNLKDYFEDCVDDISLDLESRGISLAYYNHVPEDTIIIADPEQLKRVINNIVGNSVKYMESGRRGHIGIFIKDEPEFVQIEIQDNGKGIAKKELPHIFERCYRTDASRNSSKGGSGLGLSIAKKIIEEHGGKIWANSVEGEGTTMSFVLRKYKECVTYE
ncbi:signal transduction histidine kinase [Frisingicoccus caecimuris]|uniref:histidine kinase n=2 Tax=Frisingicoccus caecimuris TaxID=1796636 RepID=A0A4R2LHK5_9FIRM|nr:HAMP domain-containing sensor histidine kinase [Frisingicoccus caecimuris]TCO84595.1 signal transduction histidine kinase [Frisingicoccus caecimuris]HAP19957.1 two-component sensor histidine kinase [Lachnospiraceae bacterium]